MGVKVSGRNIAAFLILVLGCLVGCEFGKATPAASAPGAAIGSPAPTETADVQARDPIPAPPQLPDVMYVSVSGTGLNVRSGADGSGEQIGFFFSDQAVVPLWQDSQFARVLGTDAENGKLVMGYVSLEYLTTDRPQNVSIKAPMVEGWCYVASPTVAYAEPNDSTPVYWFPDADSMVLVTGFAENDEWAQIIYDSTWAGDAVVVPTAALTKIPSPQGWWNGVYTMDNGMELILHYYTHAVGEVSVSLSAPDGSYWQDFTLYPDADGNKLSGGVWDGSNIIAEATITRAGTHSIMLTMDDHEPRAQGTYTYQDQPAAHRSFGSTTAYVGKIRSAEDPSGSQWVVVFHETSSDGKLMIRKIVLNKLPDSPQIIYTNIPCSLVGGNRNVVWPLPITEDVNADGYVDFVVPYTDASGNARDCIWLFDAAAGELVRAPE